MLCIVCETIWAFAIKSSRACQPLSRRVCFFYFSDRTNLLRRCSVTKHRTNSVLNNIVHILEIGIGWYCEFLCKNSERFVALHKRINQRTMNTYSRCFDYSVSSRCRWNVLRTLLFFTGNVTLTDGADINSFVSRHVRLVCIEDKNHTCDCARGPIHDVISFLSVLNESEPSVPPFFFVFWQRVLLRLCHSCRGRPRCGKTVKIRVKNREPLPSYAMEISDEYQDMANPGGGVAMVNIPIAHHQHTPDSPLVSFFIFYLYFIVFFFSVQVLGCIYKRIWIND